MERLLVVTWVRVGYYVVIRGTPVVLIPFRLPAPMDNP